MASQNEIKSSRKWIRGRRARGTLVFFMGCLALLAPFFAGPLAVPGLVGLLLIVCGVLEISEVFLADDDRILRSAYLSGAVSILGGMLLLAYPHAVLRGVSYLLAALFFMDGVGKMAAVWRTRAVPGPWRRLFIGGLVNLGLALILVVRWPVSGVAVAVILVGLRHGHRGLVDAPQPEERPERRRRPFKKVCIQPTGLACPPTRNSANWRRPWSRKRSSAGGSMPACAGLLSSFSSRSTSDA